MLIRAGDPGPLDDLIEDEITLLKQHADVLFDMDATGRLVSVNEPDADPAPRLFLARGQRSALVWLRSDVPASTVAACERLARELPAWNGHEPQRLMYEGLRRVLAQDEPISVESRGPAYRFGDRVDASGIAETQVIDARSSALLERYFPYTRSEPSLRSPVVVAVRDGSAVSACFCARKRPNACEAGVATEDRFQGQGLATAVVAAWRDAVEDVGSMPLYSTSWDNRASRAVARKLGLMPYADTLSLA